MKRKTLINILILFTVSLIVVVVLFVVSEDMVHRRNSFLRQFPPHTLKPLDTIDIGFNSYYVAGSTAHNLYLGNTTSLLRLLRIDLDCGDTSHIFLEVRDIGDLKIWSLRTKVDSPYFYLGEGTVPVVYRGNVNDGIASERLYDKAFFLDFAPISSSSIALRSLSSETNEYELGKEVSNPPHASLNNELLEKQVDGRFCVDGMMHFSEDIHKLVYVYYYRNQFIVADSNLNLIYRGKTIDTVSHAQITIAGLSSGFGRMHAAPPLFVNKQSRVWKHFLFVNSGLLSKNEKREAFEQSSVIDVYDLRNGGYQFSFYIPYFGEKRMHDFFLTGNKLVVLVDRHVLTYDLVKEYFRPSINDILHVESGT
jgi:hypothetical protein